MARETEASEPKVFSRETVEFWTVTSGSLSYEAFDEPVDAGWPAHVLNLYVEAMRCMRRSAWKDAERHLRKALQVVPSDPNLRNNFACVIEAQGRKNEALEMITKLHEEHPEYIFGITGLAGRYIAEDHLERARELLEPVRNTRRLHVSELKSLCSTQFRLEVASMQFAEALEWLDLLEIVDPDNPELDSELADIIRLQSGIKALMEDSAKYAARRAAKKKTKPVQAAEPVPQMTLPFDS